MKKNLSVLIVAKNEEKNLNDCLESVKWADEIVVIDNGSDDKTASVAKKYTTKVFSKLGGDFSDRKNFGVSKTTGDYLFFIDADEIVDEKLKKEIQEIISLKTPGQVFAVPRKNIILGYPMVHGGWWPDYVIRLFKRENFKGFVGLLHEQPQYEGELKYLKNPLIHKKHSNFEEMIEKTNKWSEIEARLMYEAGHPKMNIPRFFTAVFREAYLRLVREKAYLDGTPGVIYGVYQVVSRFISYAKLWEMQNRKK